MDAELIERVRQVIGRTGETQNAVAERIGIAPDKLSKSLTGKRRFTSLELALIAEAGETTVDWLLRGVEPRTALGAAARKSSECEHTTSDVRAILGRYEQVIDGLSRIDYTLPRQTLPNMPSVDRLVDQGSQLAISATKALESEPWLCSARELAAQCERAFGIEIAAVSLPDGLDGLSWSTDCFNLILVASTRVWTRLRFTLAHEVGHILAGDAHDVVAEKVQPGRSSAVKEVRANAFAAEFLMPREAVLGDAAGPPSRGLVAELAWKYKVSPSAMATRLKVLGVIDADRQREWSSISTLDSARIANAVDEHMLNAVAGERGWHPNRLTDLTIKAYAHGDITVRPLASLLGVAVDDLLDLLEPTPLPEAEQTLAAPSDNGAEFAFTP